MNETPKLTIEKVVKYMTGQMSAICPCCGSSRIEGHSLDQENDCVYQIIDCPDCGISWTDIYELIGVTTSDGDIIRADKAMRLISSLLKHLEDSFVYRTEMLGEQSDEEALQVAEQARCFLLAYPSLLEDKDEEDTLPDTELKLE